MLQAAINLAGKCEAFDEFCLAKCKTAFRRDWLIADNILDSVIPRLNSKNGIHNLSH